jgi:flagellar basal body-associated protein FliL
MKKKLIPVVILLVVLGGVYKMKFAKAAPVEKHKIDGQVYVLPKEFLVNLADGRFAKLNVGLILAHDMVIAPEAGGHGGGPKIPEGFGPLVQEAIVRDIITDELTDAADHELINRAERKALKKRLVKAIAKDTDVKVEDVLLTDVAVQ